jgi:hypothetical protein
MDTASHVLVIAGFAALVSGCTAIGAVVGHSIDASRPDSIVVSRSYAEDTLRTGEETLVTLSGGSVVSGELAGYRRADEEEYGRAYQAWRDSAPSGRLMPRLWTRIRVTGQVINPITHRGNGIRYDCRLAGIDMGGILIAATAGHKTLRIPTALIDTLFLDENRALSGAGLRRITATERPPLCSVMGIRYGNDTLWIPLDRIERASQRFTKDAMLLGIWAGLAIDVTAAYLISHIKLGPFIGNR